MKRLRDESGQVMVLTVLCMTVLLGFIAFAVDVGLLLRAQRVMQIAADSAAIAGASMLPSNDPATIRNAAWTDATLNGVTNGVNQAVVTVNPIPLSGPFLGNTNYVEVIVSQSQPTFFMRLFGQSSIAVSARAVATDVSPPNCVYALTIGITLENNASLNAPSCGVLDNGVLDATQGTVNAATVGVEGLISNLLGINPLPALPPIALTNPVNNPLSYLGLPPPSVCVADPKPANGSIGPSNPNQPVCYSGLTLSGGNITLNPGTYVIDGGGANKNAITISNSATVTGNGVTIILTNGAVFSADDNTNPTVNLTAPTSGTYAGILFYQDPSDPQPMTINASNLWNLTGIIYLPNSELILHGTTGVTLTTDLVVGSLEMNDVPFTITPYESLSGPSPIVTPKLAE